MKREHLTAREAARFDLVRRVVHDEDTLEQAFAHAVQLSAETLSVARVGIWLFEHDGASIRCVVQHERGSPPVRSNEIIDLVACSRYAAALRTHRAVVADDARNDPQTSELKPYFERHGITALLDSPVFQLGEPVAVLCHEHVGGARSWSTYDKHFAATVSDMLGLYLEQRAAHAHYVELLKARRELEERHRMESLGRLAASVAHDVNNLLVAISLKTDLLRHADAASGARDKAADELLGIVDQGARLVRQLLDVGRPLTSSEEISDLAEVVRELEPALRAHARGGIHLELDVPADPARVRIERSRAEQVVMNLAINACDALLGGGNLAIRVAVEPKPGFVGASDVVLRVSDTGVGMDEETRERMWEPFFSTKREGGARGLGLATVHGAVTASQGKLDVKSALGAGTTFTIRWPEATGF
jgi:signal transduction histidine kinase